GLGALLAAAGKLKEAVASYDQALRLRPDLTDAHLNRAQAWLVLDDFEQGWPEYEWRWRYMTMPPYAQPRWDGGDLAGKTVLLYAEQGLGDTLQFIRYAPLVQERGATVVVACPAPLVRLLARCPGIDQILAEGSPLPPCDVQAPLLSLPD